MHLSFIGKLRKLKFKLKLMTNDTKFTLQITAIFFFLIFLAFAGYKFQKWVNYEFNYSSQVEEQIIRTVKKECLKSN